MHYQFLRKKIYAISSATASTTAKSGEGSKPSEDDMWTISKVEDNDEQNVSRF